MTDHLSNFFHFLEPEQDFSVTEWADSYRYLSQKSSSEPGKWRTDRTPYLKAIFEALSTKSPIQRVVFMAGAQIGKTEAGLCWLGYIIHHSPGPVMLVQPTVDMAKRLSKQRIDPMIEETPVLRQMIADKRTRDSGNTQLMKDFQGGVMIMTGANSSVGLRSMPVRYCFMDEVDAWPVDVDGEGDPVKLAERRTTTFARKKIYIVSTPTIKESSRIEKSYLATNQQKYHVPCPHCGNMDWIRWENMKWQDKDPKTARLQCLACESLIEERYKTQMLSNGEWRGTVEGSPKTAGFHLSSLYSPLGWKSWEEIVEEFLSAKDDPPRLKEWVNTVLAETWEEDYSSKIGMDELASRAEPYRMNTVPLGGLLMTAGVDVQDNRLAVVVKAWGQNEETWLVSWQEIYGDISDLSVSGPWHQLDNILATEYKRDDGVSLKIRATAIDTGGHFTHETYMYCRSRKHLGVIAIKGSSLAGKPALGKPTKQDVNYKGQVFKSGVDLWAIGTDTIKLTIYSRLKRPQGQGQAIFHFPAGLPTEYFDQLTAEKQITRYRNGFAMRIWTKKDGVRNEALDCEVYAYSALQYLYIKHDRNTIWLQAQQIIDKLKPEKELVKPYNAIDYKEEDDSDTMITEPVTLPPQPPPVRRPPIRRGTGFVNSWRL